MSKKITTEIFINKAIIVHGDKYDYSKTIYINSREKIIIICKEHGEFEQTPNNHLNGNNCTQCSLILRIRKRSSNTEEFIKKATLFHGYKYDYSKVIYIKASEKIIIICKDHGEFKQTPNGHLNNGCKQCSMDKLYKNKQSNTKEFIEKAIKIHGEKYDYSKVNYTKAIEKVIIICRTHGEFLQTPNKHLGKSGCSKCSNSCKNIDTEYFIICAKEKHGNKYDYSKVDYKSSKDKIIIICKIHGEFKQDTSNHLQGQGCKKCGKINISILRKSNTKEFIEKVIKIHGDKYDYSKVDYKSSKDKVIIICKDHGEFEQESSSHLLGCGCKKCGVIETHNKLKSNTEEFINKAILIHGNRYDYSKTIYTKAKEKVIIICKEHGEFLQSPDSHKKCKGCKKCSIIETHNKQKSNTEEFIQKAILIHGDKYDYSKVDYKKAINKVKIICKEHGEFLQTASDHLSSRGCKKCGIKLSANAKLSNTKEFIQKAILIHSDKYDYSKVNYNKAIEKIIIICKNHGEFKQTPNDHLSNYGCPICGYLFGSIKQRSNTEEFIKKAILIHKNKYDYSKVNYINNTDKVFIICKLHGEFKQGPNTHLSGCGCTKCGIIISSDAKKLNNEEFLKRSISIHGDKYNYSKVEYIGNKYKVNIICKKHGEFLQTPSSHYNGSGCPRCTKQFSKPQIQWLELLEKLNNIKIQHAMNDVEYKIPTTRYRADGYCEETNTIYEFHGDYFHGNPKIFDSEEENKLCNATHGELYQKTLKKEQKIRDLGYNLVVMWESDWIKINKSIRTLQYKFRNN